MRIAIIGAGLTGLTVAYRLSQKGHRVTVFEKEKYAGGLAAGFKKPDWNWPLENFFHHFFTSDTAAKNLIAELRLSDKLFYSRPKTSIFLKGKIHQFDSPIAVLKFPHLSPLEKLHVGAITTYLKNIPPRRSHGFRSVSACHHPRRDASKDTSEVTEIEKVTAKEWLQKYYGQKPYQILWQPLLKGKFGDEASQISMTWFWGRIKKRSAKLGYLEGGFQTLIDKLVEEIKKNGDEVLLKKEVKNLNNIYYYSDFDRVIVTTPISTLLKIAPDLPRDYQTKLKKLKMLGAVNLILVLKEKFLTDNTYWLNINEPNFPFVAVVEHTNFIEPKHYGGHHILYIGGYYPQNHRYFKMTKEQILKEFLPYLKKINPQFNQLSAISYQLSAIS